MQVVDAGEGSSSAAVRGRGTDAGTRDAGGPAEIDAAPPESFEPGGACKTAKDCPRGQACDERTCRRNCRDDAECPSGICAGVKTKNGRSSTARVCWAACSREDTSACGPGVRCRTLSDPRGETGTYCAAPADPCPTIEDGTCDDSRGTGECADGTDAKDCNCTPLLADAHCDPVAQCGCPKEQACAVARDAKPVSAACLPWTGTKRDEGACKADADCAAGYVCRTGGTCARLCNDDSACSRGACRPLVWGAPSEGLNVCYLACDRMNPSCPEGTQCAHFDGRFPFQGDYCVAPVAKCPAPDGVCDESRGSALCAKDTDVVDCCQSSLPGGECDLVKQCGCEKKPGLSCAEGVSGKVDRTSVCAPPGITTANNWCLDDASCASGLGCSGHVCRPYCVADADCGDGARCISTVRGGVTTSERVCLGPCTPESNEPCGPVTRCNTGVFEDRPATGCTLVPFTSECPTDNGRCDEPQGTGICAPGSDTADCATR